jgi:hypothetical protein
VSLEKYGQKVSLSVFWLCLLNCALREMCQLWRYCERKSILIQVQMLKFYINGTKNNVFNNFICAWYTCMCDCWHMCSPVHMWQSEHNFWMSILSFYLVKEDLSICLFVCFLLMHCFLQASWLMSFWVVFISLLPVVLQKCWGYTRGSVCCGFPQRFSGLNTGLQVCTVCAFILLFL